MMTMFLEKRRISAYVQTAVGGIVQFLSFPPRKECGDTGFFIIEERDWGQGLLFAIPEPYPVSIVRNRRISAYAGTPAFFIYHEYRRLR